MRVEYAQRGICHIEGGWPKDINLDDPEQIVRFRKKAEKDESYLQAVMQMSSVRTDLQFKIEIVISSVNQLCLTII